MHILDFTLLIIIAMSNTLSFAQVRQPAVAGQLYTADSAKLQAEVSHLLRHQTSSRPKDNVCALIVPHAGYVFSGQTAASAFALLNPEHTYKRVFLLGPSHHVWLDGASADCGYAAYRTPIGDVPVDVELCKLLAEQGGVLTYRPEAHDAEHCLEVELPFLQCQLKQMPPIVPIIISTEDTAKLSSLAHILKPYLNADNLFVISSDFSHYPAYNDAEDVDRATAQAIMTGKSQCFFSQITENSRQHIPNLATSACGACAIGTLMLMTDGDKRFDYHHISYCNSGDAIYHERQRVVGYHAFAITLNTEKAQLHDEAAPYKSLPGLARKSMEAHLRGQSFTPQSALPELRQRCGAFVTLHTADGKLRGCVGHFGEDMHLQDVVARMAVSAAFKDPRFLPVEKDELKSLKIEVSVLTPMKRINSLDEMQLGRDGIYVRKGWRSGTFLPQVADEVNWTKEEFVDHCAHDKAGLAWGEWKSAELYTSRAIIVHE